MSEPKRKSITPKALAKTVKRHTKKTVIVSQLQPERIQMTVAGIFKQYDYEPIDLDALIYLTMQRFDVSASSYETIYKVVRGYILSSNDFQIRQGKYLLLADVGMRRLLISYNPRE